MTENVADSTNIPATREEHRQGLRSVLRHYIFAADHKTIGKQYFFLSLVAVFTAIACPGSSVPSGMAHGTASVVCKSCSQCGAERDHDPGILFIAPHNPRHNHGFFCADYRALWALGHRLRYKSVRRRWLFRRSPASDSGLPARRLWCCCRHFSSPMAHPLPAGRLIRHSAPWGAIRGPERRWGGRFG